MGQGSFWTQSQVRKKWLLFVIVLLLFATISSSLVFKNSYQISLELQTAQKELESIFQPSDTSRKVRKTIVAGKWYPANKIRLQQSIKTLFRRCQRERLPGRVRALVVPHAGWQYSGKVAASAFQYLGSKNNVDYDQVVILAPSHYLQFRGASLPNATHYKTPLGLVKVSRVVEELLTDGPEFFHSLSQVHSKEHAIEAELPFLQAQLSNFTLLPLVIGSNTREEDLKEIADALEIYTGENTLWVVSADFTHYGPRYNYTPFTGRISSRIRQIDFGAIEAIRARDGRGFFNYVQDKGATIDGQQLVPVLLQVLKEEKLNITLLDYQTSGNLTGDYTNSVSYVAMALTQPFHDVQGQVGGFEMDDNQAKDSKGEFSLPESEQNYLLDLAREAIKKRLETGEKPQVDESGLPQSLKEEKGCFVTLNKQGDLRGCIGHIEPQEALYKSVIDNAVNAAVNDRRFSSLTSDELDEIEIEISVLTVPQEVSFSSGQDLKEKLRQRVDGVILKQGVHQSTYLPQVWEQLPNKEQFLSRLCRKGGMRQDCWQDTDTQVFTYQAFVFSE